MKLISSLLFLALLASCGGVKKSNVDTVSIYNKWELSVLNNEQVASSQPIYLELTDDNKVSGFVGCNRLTGSYVLKNENQIVFEQIGTTRMACSPMDMEIERQVLEMLTAADNFRIENAKLTISNAAKAPLASFYLMSKQEIVNKYWKLIQLDGQAVEMAENQEREQYFMLRSNGTVMGFAGCNHFNGQYELADENRIAFNENMAVTMMACPDVEVDESAFLKVFQLSDNYSINGDTLSIKVGNEVVSAVFEAIYF